MEGFLKTKSDRCAFYEVSTHSDVMFRQLEGKSEIMLGTSNSHT